MKKLVFFIFLIVIGVVGMVIGGNFGKDSQQHSEKKQSANRITVTPKISEQQIGVPQLFQIPKLTLKAHIESVGMDTQGRMATPKDADNVAWYNLGNKPGKPGNAVIAGHFDKASGAPAVFWNLDKLVVGDRVVVTDDNGKDITFAVVRKVKYPYNDFPLQEVFGSSTESLLNLITCQGGWNNTTKNYSHRLVVYAKRVE